MPQVFKPLGKSFDERLKAFLSDVKTNYSLTIDKDNGRTVNWQQKHHVAHMFLFNAYKSTKPNHTETGKRTIAWSHFSDPKVIWNTISYSDFLRTSINGIPQKTGLAWSKGFEPNHAATKKHVMNLLIKAGIGNSGKAMISSGLQSCGEPCACGAGRSKHLDGVAADLNSLHLTTLESKLTNAKAGSLDNYLKIFELHRPLLNHPSSPEKWHIEALP